MADAELFAWHNAEEDHTLNTFTKRDVGDDTDSSEPDDCQLNCQFLNNVIQNVSDNGARDKICRLGKCMCISKSFLKGRHDACDQCREVKNKRVT